MTSFFDSYIFFAAGVDTIKDQYDRSQKAVEIACIRQGQPNIYQRILATRDWTRAEWLWKRGCDYYLGERFMHALYIDLGHDMVAGSLQELHRRPGERRSPLTEENIYDIFLSHTPSEKTQLFQDIYTCFHGMPVSGQIPSPSADCDNLPLGPGTEVRDPTLLVEALTPGPRPTPTLSAQGLDDRKTLLAIDDAINNVTSWKETDQMNLPLESWRGVFATDEAGNVTGLNLNNTRIDGPIPPEIGNLVHLEWLTITSAHLTGPLPPELGNLVNLTKLELNANRITGPLPPELGNLVNLQELNLQVNEVDGSLPPELGKLTSLTSMNFESNRLTGFIPSEFGNLTALEKLNLRNNQLTGSLPPELGNLVNLIDLGLGTNQLSGEIPAELARLENLRGFSLRAFGDNEFTGCVPAGSPDIVAKEMYRLKLPDC